MPAREALGLGDEWFRSGVRAELYTLATISLPAWLYFALAESSPWRATLGKRLVRLRVTRADGGERMRFPRALARTLVKLLPWELAHLANNLPVPLWYASEPELRLGFVASGLVLAAHVVAVALTPRRQALHDLVARTAVVRG